jgi:hypothetical protein
MRGQTMKSHLTQTRTCQSSGPWHPGPILIGCRVPLTWAPGQCCLCYNLTFTSECEPV